MRKLYPTMRDFMPRYIQTINKDEAFLVEGRIPHSCWNNIDGVTKMIGISVI